MHNFLDVVVCYPRTHLRYGRTHCLCNTVAVNCYAENCRLNGSAKSALLNKMAENAMKTNYWRRKITEVMICLICMQYTPQLSI